MPLIAWIILYAAFSIGIYDNLLGIVTPKLQAAFVIDYKQVSFLMSLMTIGPFVGSLLGGDIAKRFPARNLLIIYVSLMLAFMLLVVNTSSYLWLIIGFSGMGVFNAALFTIGHTLLAGVTDDEDHRTRMLSLADVGFSSGAVLAPVWASLCFQWQDTWQAPYSAYMMLLALLLLVLVPKSFYPMHLAPSHTPNQPQSVPITEYFKILREPVIGIALLSFMAVGFVEWGQSFWLMSYLVKGLQLRDGLAHTSVFCLLLGMLAGRFWHAFIPSRWSADQKLQGLALLCVFGVVTQNLLGLTGWVKHSIELFWLCSFATGLGMSIGFPILLGRMVDQFPDQAPRLSGLASIAVGIGSSVAALLVGYLATWLNMLQAFLVFIIAAVTYWALASWVVRSAKLKAANS